MRIEDLTREDRKIFKSFLVQIFYTCLFIAIGCVVFLFAMIFIIESSENIFIADNRFALKSAIIVLCIIVFTASAWMLFERPVQDKKWGKVNCYSYCNG